MNYSYPGFRPKIVVFGETYKALDVNDKIDLADPIVLYQIAGKEQPHPRAASMSDWLKWDKDAREAQGT